MHLSTMNINEIKLFLEKSTQWGSSEITSIISVNDLNKLKLLMEFNKDGRYIYREFVENNEMYIENCIHNGSYECLEYLIKFVRPTNRTLFVANWRYDLETLGNEREAPIFKKILELVNKEHKYFEL